MLHAQQGATSDAEKYFQRLAQADPSLYVPYLALGDLYTARRDFTKAQASYSKGYALAPQNALIVAGGMNAAIEAHDLSARADMAEPRYKREMKQEPQVLREKERYLSFKGKYQESADSRPRERSKCCLETEMWLSISVTICSISESTMSCWT